MDSEKFRQAIRNGLGRAVLWLRRPTMTYLLHFDTPYRHPRHYTGWARDPQTFARRIEHHRKGTGARLTAVAAEAGITFTVARTWTDGDRAKERRLKNSGGASRYCPVCQQQHAA